MSKINNMNNINVVFFFKKKENSLIENRNIVLNRINNNLGVIFNHNIVHISEGLSNSNSFPTKPRTSRILLRLEKEYAHYYPCKPSQ